MIVDIRQTAAKCAAADACHTAGDCDACQIDATVEYTAANACHAVRNRNACQTAAIVECIISDACSSGDDYFFQRCGNMLAIVPIVRRTKYIAEVRLSAAICYLADKGDCDAGQTAASGECAATDACHAVRNRDTCQIAAIVECIISYLCRTFGDNYIFLQQLPIDIEIVGIIHRICRGTGKIYLQPSR